MISDYLFLLIYILHGTQIPPAFLKEGNKNIERNLFLLFITSYFVIINYRSYYSLYRGLEILGSVYLQFIEKLLF